MEADECFIFNEFTDLSLFFVGSEHCTPKHSYSVGFNDRYLMHYIVSGKGKFICNNKVFNLEAGSAFVIGGSEKGGYYEADDVDPWYYIWINFAGDMAVRFMDILGIDEYNPVYKTTDAGRINRCFENLILSQNETNTFLIYGGFFTTLGEMIKYSANEIKERKPSGTEYVDMCKRFIEFHYFNNIKVSDLCSLAGIEHSYLFRLFKTQTGVGPMDYIIRFRMSKAAKLLQNTNMTVADVAIAVGYEDRFAFSKIFKKINGVSPRGFRQRKE